MNRSEAREAALRALYTADVMGRDEPDLDELKPRARRYVEGVWAERRDLDARIDEVAEHWRVSRMPPVDRNLLRLGLWELRHTDAPVGVVVSEMVDLANRYSTERSGRFINGILARLARELRGEDVPEDNATARENV